MLKLIEMKMIPKRLLPILLIIALVAPMNVSAQETPAENAPIPESVPVETPAPAIPEVPIVVEVPSTSAEETPPAPEVQETIESELLEEAANPQESISLEEAIEVIDEATEEMEAEEIEVVVEATSTEAVIEIMATTTQEVLEVLEPIEEEVAEMPLEILEPTKEYSFAINGGSIATEETPEWSKNAAAVLTEQAEVSTEKITEEPGISIADASKKLTVTGICSDVYFVVLLYKDAQGYNTNPSSYIYNRAFPCENGQYSYSVSELPFDLETGTFYLLVAGQGERGPWKPISSMIPIGITVKTIIPEETLNEESSNEPAP